MCFQKCFNTASVLIQRIEMQRGEIYIVFQYSFCSYSTVCYSDAWKISGGFNTASVLIQQIKGVWRDGIAQFQYSFCSYSTEYLEICQKKQVVSIQLLFLFNLKQEGDFLDFLVSIQLLFLFNFVPSFFYLNRNNSFNTASVLIQQMEFWGAGVFKYVSIQLLFLFNAYTGRNGICWGVSIQLLFLFN